jgi:hypothetical protein
MKQISIVLIVFLLAACAADPVNVQNVGEEEAARLISPSRALSSFSEVQLLDMEFSDAIRQEQGKVIEARQFEAAYNVKMKPLVRKWNKAANADASGKLIIKSDLVRLKIVSGGARFWAGAFAGDSFIDMDLTLVEAYSGEIISQVNIRRNASSMTGAWSIGKSDQNLDQYIVSIVYEYLTRHY